MNQKTILAACCLLLVSLLTSPSLAQDNLPETEKAIACIDIRLDKLRDSEMAKSLNLQETFNQMVESEGPPLPVSTEKIKRIFGAVSLPENMERAMGMSPFEPLALNFFVELQFVDAAATDAMMEDMPKEQTTEANGKTFFVLGPENVWAIRKSPNTLVLGTEDFMTREYGNVFSDNLRSVWKESNDAPIRAAVDMKTRGDFLGEIMEMAKSEAPPMFAPMIDVIDNAESLKMAIDLDAEQFFALKAMGIDEQNADELRGVLDGLLGMAKMASAGEIENMKQQVPQMADAAQKMMDQLKATGEGREVNIFLTMPEGIDKIMAEAVTSARAQALEAQKLNRLRQVCLAMHNHMDAYKKFPFDPAGNERINESISWRVHLLPFLEENNLYNQLSLAEATDSETNAGFADKMPELFGADGKNTDIVIIQQEAYPKTFSNIPDGTSNTIVMLEYPAGKPWLERNDITIDEAVELFASLDEGDRLAAAFYDGSVRYLKAGIPEEMLRALLTPNDGEIIPWEEMDRWSGR